MGVLLPRYRGNKAGSVLVSSVTVPLGERLRFPAIAEGKSSGRVRYFFVDDPIVCTSDGRAFASAATPSAAAG